MSRKRPRHRRPARKREADGETQAPPKVYRMIDPETGETKEVEFQSKAYWDLLQKKRKYAFAKGTAVAGRPKKLQKLGYTQDRLWDRFQYWNRRPKALRDFIGSEGVSAIYEAIARKITEEQRLKKPLHPKTVARFFRENPIPPDYKKKERYDESEAYKQFLKRADVGESTLENYKQGISNFYSYMKEEHPDRADDPTAWKHDDVTEWRKARFKEGYSTNSIRVFLVGIRRMWQLGLERSPAELQRLTVKHKETKKKKPETIDYFPTPQIQRMSQLIPVRNYSLSQVMADGKPLKRTLKSSPTYSLAYKACLFIAADCGSRSGQLPSTKWFGERAGSRALYKQTFDDATGIISLRYEDIRFITLDKRAPTELQGKEVAILTLHEKMGHTWKNIYLRPETTQVLKQYLKQRIGREPTNAEFDATISSSFAGQRRREFSKFAVETAVPAEIASKIRDPKRRKREVKRIGRKLRDAYRENLVFGNLNAGDLHTLIYAIIHRAEQQGNPIKDQHKRPWTTQRLYEEPHKFHLLRKSFAQNLVAKGVPIELIADYGVGWSDLTTLKDYYGKASQERLMQVYYQKVVGETT